LERLADAVLLEQPLILRKKFEHVMTELIHQRDVTMEFIKGGVNDVNHYSWNSQMRFYFNPKEADVLRQLSVQISNANFLYGFEYLGIGTKLVQTPLTDVGFTTLTQGLKACQGGAPFGPAGTGKTESVKMLARQLGW
jgi:dynein heavy chain 1